MAGKSQPGGNRCNMAGAVIFHTADLHNRLSPAAARQLAQMKREHPGALLLDAGDAVAAGNLTYKPGGEPILRLMSEAGYDAMAMGNRESHPYRRILENKLRDAVFPILAANLVSRSAPLPEMIREYVIFDITVGKRLAVIGLAPQMTRPDSVWSRVTDYVFDDPVATLRKLVSQLKKEADLVICLSHCGVQKDRALAVIPEVDLILGGHSHHNSVTQDPGQAMIVHPGYYGRQVACTEIITREQVKSELQSLEDAS